MKGAVNMKRIAAVLFATTLVASVSNAATIYQRRENQQDRIAQGIASGNLSAREAARLERQQAILGNEIHDFRALDGGKLTKSERVLVYHQQNQLSRNIYRVKHDGKGR
jgi:hypothetical protein